MIKYTLYIGLNDKDTHTQIISDINARNIVANICASRDVCVTVSDARGVYKHDDGTVVIENTLRCEFVDCEKSIIKAIANDSKRALNQESVMLSTEVIENDFI